MDNIIYEDWRKKGIELLPEIKDEFLYYENTPYLVLSEIARLAENLLKTGKLKAVNPYFEFAEWCHEQNSKDLWNAAGVCFYESIFDDDLLEKEVSKLVPFSVFSDVLTLLEWKYSETLSKSESLSKMERIKNLYKSPTENETENEIE